MRDDDDRLVTHEVFDRLLDLRLRLVVNGRGRFVEDEDRRLPQYGTRNGNPLFLTAGETHAAFTDHGRVTLGHFPDESVRTRNPRRFVNVLFRCTVHAVCDVVEHGAVEEEHVLQNDGNVVAQGRERDVLRVVSVDEDFARLRIIEPLEQGDDCGFADACCTDEGDHLTGFGAERNVVENLRFLRVAERDVFEFHISLTLRNVHGVVGFLNFAFRVKKLENPLRTGTGHLNVLGETCKSGQRCVEQGEIHEKSHDISGGHRAFHGKNAAHTHDDYRADGGHEFHGRVVNRVVEIRADVDVGVVLAVILHLDGFASLLAERLDFLHAGEIVLSTSVESREHFLIDLEERCDLGDENPREKDDERHRDHRVQREQRIDPENHDAHTHNHHDICRHIGNGMRDQHLHLAGIVNHPRHDLPGLLVGVVAHRERFELVVAHPGQVSDEIPRADMGQPHGEEPESAPEKIRADHDADVEKNRVGGQFLGRREQGSELTYRLRCYKTEHGRRNQRDNGKA